VDHAQNGPAYGWVKNLRRMGNLLVASVKILSKDFLDWLKNGAYRKRSIELYRKFSSTGRPYLRALSFLGAAPPEVKGLSDPVFTDQGEFVPVEFREEIPKEVPAEQPIEKKDDELMALMQERDDLKSRIEILQRERQRAEMASFCERLKIQGKVLPAWEKKGLIDFLLSLDNNRAAQFGEMESITPLAWFCKFLEEMEPRICLEEIAKEPGSSTMPDMGIPKASDAAYVSPESVEIHKRARRFQEKHPGISYTEALARISSTHL
ncbi:hypothetical protein JW926_00650, partial [Candidatus Sumerlaeota bacterium]|nr:hypothetical protein [Candidatus Sumerlaeota bacterium]